MDFGIDPLPTNLNAVNKFLSRSGINVAGQSKKIRRSYPFVEIVNCPMPLSFYTKILYLSLTNRDYKSKVCPKQNSLKC